MNITQSITNTTVTTNSFTQISGGKWRWQLILTPNTNYYFDTEKNGGDYTATVTYPSGYINTITGRILSNGTLFFQFDFTSQTTAQNSNCVVNGDVFTDTTTISITENLTQCTLSGLPSNIYSDTELNLTLTANQNYHFTTAPTLILTDSNNNNTTLNFTISANALTATINCNLANYQNIESININGVAVLLPAKTIPIIQNLLNCSSNAPQNVSEYDSTITITLTANNNYLFTNENTPYVNFYDEDNLPISDLDGNSYYNFTITNNGLNATLNLNVARLNWNYTAKIELNATAISETPTPETVSIYTNISNAILTGLPQVVYTNTVLNLTLTANENCEFQTTPVFSYYDTDGNTHSINFVLNQNRTIATLQQDLSLLDIYTGTINGNAVVITPYEDRYGSINIYKITEQNLGAFAAQRFFVENISKEPTSPNYQQIDLGVYVNSIKRLYINVGNTSNDVLKCGNYNTNIAVQTPLNDNIIIECGNVEIPHPNNDITDFNSEIDIFLPFIGFQNIPSDYIGKTISLQYICNIITANAVAKLICDNIVFAVYECDISSDIIYKTSEKQTELKNLGTLDFNMNVLKGLQPYIKVKYFNSQNNKIYNSDNVRTVLNTLNGFNCITEITNFNNDFITLKEFEMLQNELNDGVFFATN